MTAPSDPAWEVPRNAVIPCPAHDFNLYPVRQCLSCPTFGGLTLVTAENVPWDARYRVMCAYPVARRARLLEAE